MAESLFTGSVPDTWFHVVIIGICAAMLLGVRLAFGSRAKHAAHLASALGFTGLAYMVPCVSDRDRFAEDWLAVTLFSLVSSGFLFTSSWLLHEQRMGERAGALAPPPAAFRVFALRVLLNLFAAIVLSVAVVLRDKGVGSGSDLLRVIDVSVACAGCWLVGYELLRIRRHAALDERSPFFEARRHAKFRWLAFSMFAIWGCLQPAVVSAIGPSPRQDPLLEGPVFAWLCNLKLLCSAAAAVLIMHSLPQPEER